MTTDLRALRRFAAGRRYDRVRAHLCAQAPRILAGTWPKLRQMEKLVFFKLLDPDRAMKLYAALPFEEKYFLLLGFRRETVAPTTQSLPSSARKLFVRLPEGCYDRMLQLLVGGEMSLDWTFDRN
ncbi:MAG: hypothetical protein WCU88_05565 [Elusimicrobiota bacterium]